MSYQLIFIILSHTHTYTCTYTCIFFIYTYIYTRTHIYIYTHIHSSISISFSYYVKKKIRFQLNIKTRKCHRSWVHSGWERPWYWTQLNITLSKQKLYVVMESKSLSRDPYRFRPYVCLLPHDIPLWLSGFISAQW